MNLKRYYKSNSLVGISFNTIWKLKLRGGQLLNQEPIDPLKVRERVDQILRDKRISESYKKDFLSGQNSPILPNSESIKDNKLRNSLMAKSEYSQYSKAKRKLPFLLMSPFTFAELNWLAAFRAAGLISASLTFPAFLGFSMPCAITFSMLKMYAPEKLKLPCKLAK